MKISKFLCAAFVSAALTGCCGTHLSTEEVHQFNLNQDTEAVVKAKLGEPWQTFYSVDLDEVNKAISGLREIKATDYIHRIGVYTFSFSPLLSHNNAYFELNMFIYRPDGVLQDVAEYTCYTQQSCEDILEAEKQKYAVEDLDRLVEDAKKLMNKKQKQLLAEKKKKADAEKDVWRLHRRQKYRKNPNQKELPYRRLSDLRIRPPRLQAPLHLQIHSSRTLLFART